MGRLLKVHSLSLLLKLKFKQILIDYFICHSQVQVVAMQLRQRDYKKWNTCVEMTCWLVC